MATVLFFYPIFFSLIFFFVLSLCPIVASVRIYVSAGSGLQDSGGDVAETVRVQRERSE